MAAAGEEILDGIPPSFRFRPTPCELVEFYLLPRARDQVPFPGVIIEDDAAGSTLPRDLFARHGLGGENEAYFLVRTAGDAKKPGGAHRQNRSCSGGACWKMQSSAEKGLRIGGERITCRRSNLNLHMGKGKDGGSVGWVMHEYTIVSPPCPSQVKICHIAFSGHGQKRKRVPDEQEECQSEDAPQSQHARVDTTAAGGCSTSGGMLNHFGAVEYASADDEERSQLVLTQDIFPQSPLVGSSEFLGFPSAASANAVQYQELEQQVPSTEEEEQVPSTEEEQCMMPQFMARQSTMAEPEQLSAEELEFWSSIGVDVESSNCAEQELWSSNGVDSNGLLPRISDFLDFPSATSANAEQCQELEQQVPGTEEQQVMMPQLMGQQSSVPDQLSAELEFWSSIVQSNNIAEQELWSLTGFESNSMVPSIGIMAGEQQDFWSLSRAGVQSNCAVPDMSVGALVGADWGSYSIIC